MKKETKHLVAVCVSMALILPVAFGTTGCRKAENAQVTTAVRGFDKEELPKELSNKQKKGLKKEYDAAYKDEKKAVDAYILEYAQNYDEYGGVKEEFENMIGSTENFYQTLNAYDPNLKDVLAQEAGQRVGDSPLESYLVEQGVGVVLSEGELGQELRGALELTGLALMEQFTIWSMESEKTTRKDAMAPVAVGENYALVRSWGNISQMLEQIDINSGYAIAEKAIHARLESLGYTFDENDYENDYEEEEQEENAFEENVKRDLSKEERNELYEEWRIKENCNGRIDALLEEKGEWEQEVYKQKSDFLKQLGIKQDVDSVISGAGISDENEADDDNEYDDDTYEDDNEYDDEYDDDDTYEDDDEYDDDTYDDEDQEEDIPVRAYYVYSIIDKEGKVYGSFFSPYDNLSAAINDDGMCSVTVGELKDECVIHAVLDKDGKILFQNDKEAKEDGSRQIYYNVTPSKNVLRKTFLSDFEHGDYQVLELVKPDGTAQKLMEGGYIKLIKAGTDDIYIDDYPRTFCGDYYEYECGYEDENEYSRGIIDMKDGRLLTGEEYEQKRYEEQDPMWIEADRAILEEAPKTREEEILRGDRLNENYILYENAIYDNSAKEVKRLEDGRGVKSILYTNGQYWIVTNSNWYYILDDKFNEVLKPVEINNADDYLLTQYGLLLEISETDEAGKSQQNAYLYDEKGEAVLKMTGVDIDNDLHGFTLGNKKAGWTNLQTKQFMLVSIPKGGVSQMVQ